MRGGRGEDGLKILHTLTVESCIIIQTSDRAFMINLFLLKLNFNFTFINLGPSLILITLNYLELNMFSLCPKKIVSFIQNPQNLYIL